MQRGLRLRRKLILRRPLPELSLTTTDDPSIIEAICKLWCTGQTDFEIKQLLGLTDTEFSRLTNKLKTTSPDTATAQKAYGELTDEYLKYTIRAEHRRSELWKLYQLASAIDPLHNCPVDFRASRRMLADINRLDNQLFAARTKLLEIKMCLGLVILPEQQPQLIRSSDGETTVFKGVTIRQAWEIRTRESLH
jgi:hypothetical protein